MSSDGKGETCWWCKRVLLAKTSRSALAATRDHVIPRSKGGSRTVWACHACNGLKGDMLPAAWGLFMAQNPGWWVDGPKPFRKMRRVYARPGTERPSVRYRADAEVVRRLARQIVDEW